MHFQKSCSNRLKFRVEVYWGGVELAERRRGNEMHKSNNNAKSTISSPAASSAAGWRSTGTIQLNPSRN